MRLLSITLLTSLLLLSGCAGHYSTSSHHGSYGYSNHIGVGIHTHGRGNQVLGALVVGGVIGHLLTKSANANKTKKSSTNKHNKTIDEQRLFYQLGEDGHCYLMEIDENEQVNVVAQAPDYSCR